MARESARLKDVEYFQQNESKLKEELSAVYERSAQQSEEITSFAAENRRLQQEISHLSDSLSESRILVQDLKSRLDTKDAELSASKTAELELRGEYEQAKAVAKTCQDEMTELQIRLSETHEQLEAETQAKSEALAQNKDKLVMVAEKINELQQTLTDTQRQVEESRRTEDVLRATIRQREETLSLRDKKITEQEHKLIDLESSLAKGEYILECKCHEIQVNFGLFLFIDM